MPVRALGKAELVREERVAERVHEPVRPLIGHSRQALRLEECEQTPEDSHGHAADTSQQDAWRWRSLEPAQGT
jgi:hypothetical protein